MSEGTSGPGKRIFMFAIGLFVGATALLGVRAATRADDPAPKSKPAEVVANPGREGRPMPAPAKKGLLVDLGNENCPIMKKPVNGKAFSEWNGLRVGHCCPPCIAKFLADPEKGLDGAGIEWRDLADMVSKANAASGHDRHRLLDQIKAKHEVLRIPEDW